MDNLPPPSLSSDATARLVQRIHAANSLAKVASGHSRRRLYEVKRRGILHFAATFPDSVYLTSLECLEPGRWLCAVSGFRLGRLHLLVKDPFEIMKKIQPSSHLRTELAKKWAL